MMEVVMKLIKVLVAAVFLLAAGVAVAGKGGPIASGYWEGSGQAVYPDGTIAEITLVEALLLQDGNFIYGGAEFMVIIGDNEPVSQEGQLSGHISGNAITGVMGGCFAEAPNCIGVGIFEGKLSGNKLRGTIVDLSDGSTSVITLHRLAR
jgi:hypothetical protein